MTEKQHKLYVFSKHYPYSLYEIFVDNEMQVMAEYFDYVRVFPKEELGDKRPMPPQFELDNSFVNNNLKRYRVGPADTGLIVQAMWDHLTDGKFFSKLRYLHRDLAYLFQKIREYKKLRALLAKRDIAGVHFYSIWMNDWTTILAIARKRGRIDNLFTRSHGYDMYDHRSDTGYIAFRRFNLRYVNSVSCASRSGFNYLSERYPALKHKFRCSVLGVFDKGTNPVNTGRMTIVTACNVNAVKRVHLAIEALKHVTVPVQWILFGDGPLMADIVQRAAGLPANVEVVFRGRVSSEQLMAFYESTPVSLFLLVSSTEGGVPVAIQEAVSFGIPVAATNVGGIAEIVSAKTGLLLDKDFDVKYLAGFISSFATHPLNTHEARGQVKAVWQQHFDARANFGSFAQHIRGEVA